MAPKHPLTPFPDLPSGDAAWNGQGIGLMPISDEEFNAIRHMVYEHFGIHLTDQKRSLVVGRLQKLMRTRGLSTFSAYIDYLKNDTTNRALGELINRISTNHTFFFRESSHFDYFRDTCLPWASSQLKRTGSRDLRVWCAGCSTGEEAYGLSMVIREFLGLDYAHWDAGLLATDISADVLATASRGVYPEDRLAMVPPALRNKYFHRQPDGNYAVVDQMREEITFRRFNLMNQVFPFKKPFHVIFCRNVMIYFDQNTREALVERFYKCTVPGGYLFIGHSESLRRNACSYDFVMPAIYRRPEV